MDVTLLLAFYWLLAFLRAQGMRRNEPEVLDVGAALGNTAPPSSDILNARFTTCEGKRCWDSCTQSAPCPKLTNLPQPEGGKAVAVETSQDGHRMKVVQIMAGNESEVPEVYTERRVTVAGDATTLSANLKQAVLGFGGAFTDSTAINLEQLEGNLASHILQDYFGRDGAQYSLGRVPMASCDFSVRQYTYQSQKAAPFELAPEDVGDATTPDGRQVKLSRVGMIQRAKELRRSFTEDDLKLFASPWTAPPWMKTGQSVPTRARGRGMHFAANGSQLPEEQVLGWVGGKLMHSHYADWAAYFANYFKEYRKLGITFWGLTIQNEPHQLPDDKAQHWETMFWNAEETADFVKGYLGPVLQCEVVDTNTSTADTILRESLMTLRKDQELCKYMQTLKIIIHDDQKPSLPEAVIPIIEDADAMKYVSGVGLHWYMAPPNEDIDHNQHLRSINAITTLFKDPSVMDETYKKLIETRKDGFLLGTEACSGFYPDPEQHMGTLSRLVFGKDATTHVVKGSFQRGEIYAEDILADLSHSVSGWTDWNLVLNEKGGPNWASNVVDAPILFISKTEYIRQPMFYYLAHFSKFMPPGTRHVATRQTNLGKPGTFEISKGQTIFGWPGNVFIEVFYREDAKHFVIQLLNRQKAPKRWSVISGGEAIWGETSGQTIQTVLWKPSWLSQ